MSASRNRSRVWIAVFTVLIGLAVSRITNGQSILTLQNDPKQWVMPNGNYSGWNYSGLDQINLSNVQNLTMAWSMQLGILDAHDGPPSDTKPEKKRRGGAAWAAPPTECQCGARTLRTGPWWRR